MSPDSVNTSVPDRQWFIVQRWQEYDAEIRANLVRILAIMAFYAVELYNYHVLQGVGTRFHRTATIIAVAWTLLALLALATVRARFLPPWLKYLTTAIDILLITILLVAGVGPQSPLVAGYFVILAVAALRLQLPLIQMATVAVVASYVMVLGCCHADWFGNENRDFRVPRHEELIVVVAMIVMGIVLGQIARRTQKLAADYAVRLERANQ
jgi:hypothetical protein